MSKEPEIYCKQQAARHLKHDFRRVTDQKIEHGAVQAPQATLIGQLSDFSSPVGGKVSLDSFNCFLGNHKSCPHHSKLKLFVVMWSDSGAQDSSPTQA